MFGSCNADGSACKALSIQSYWTKIANAQPGRAAAAIADFNRRYSFAKAFIAEDGRPALQRYLTDDYGLLRSEEHTSELQSLMRISYAVFCLQKKNSTYSTQTQEK